MLHRHLRHERLDDAHGTIGVSHGVGDVAGQHRGVAVDADVEVVTLVGTRAGLQFRDIILTPRRRPATEDVQVVLGEGLREPDKVARGDSRAASPLQLQDFICWVHVGLRGTD